MKKAKLVVSGILCAVMALSLVAVGGTKAAAEEAPAPSGANYKILFMPKLTNIPYFQSTNEGAQEVAKELGIEVIYDGPTEADASAQVQMLENYIAQGVDAIVVGPNDPAAVTSVLKKAGEAGIIVLDWDTQADPTVTDGSVYNVIDEEFGKHMVDKLVEYMGTDEGDIAIITGGLEAANLNAWIDAGQEYMAEEYPGLNVVTIEPSNESQDEAYQDTKDVLTAYPSVIGILGYSSPTGPGCGKAIADMGLQDKVAVVANGLEEDCQEVLKNGGLKCACLWSTQKLGRLSIATAYYMLENDGAFPQEGEKIAGWSDPIISDGEHNVYLTAGGEDYEAK
ncbi:MAG: autoinducer 2 ABC transporter substrate-binding protein [Eubacterium sp.]|nr:autoinducer 2 ABC transporter substrate-binding protein [Eubacterium sp.]